MELQSNNVVNFLDLWSPIEMIDEGSTCKYINSIILNEILICFRISVHLVKEILSGKQRVLKLYKPTVNPDIPQLESKIALSISHPRICAATQYFSRVIIPPSGDEIVANTKKQPIILPALVLEYVPNGDLVTLTKSLGCLPEAIARTYFVQLLDAIECMHLAGICHLDIKPDNILLDENYSVKLSDFGLSLEVFDKPMMNGVAGTPPYFSPEMHRNLRYDGFQADLFALGVTLFTMVVGTLPFSKAKFDDRRYKLIIEERYEEFWKLHESSSRRGPAFYNQSFRDLIQKMLSFKVETRLSIQKIRNHEWVRETCLSDANLKDLISSFLSRVRRVFSKSYVEIKKEKEERANEAKLLSSQ